MIDTWNLDYAAIAFVVTAVALFGLYQAPHLHRLNPGWAALLVTLVVLYERLASGWLVIAVLILWFVRDSAPLPAQVAIVVAGAAATAMELLGHGTTLPWVLLLAVPALGLAFDRAGRLIDDETVWILLVVSVVGQWAGAPDTEATVVVVVVVALFAADALRSGARVLPASWWPLVAVILWASAWGSIGKPSAMAGCLACFGVLLAEPIRSWIAEAVLRGTDPTGLSPELDPATRGTDPAGLSPGALRETEPDDGSWEPPFGVLLLIHAPSVLLASRVAAVSSRPGVAVGIALAVIVIDVIAPKSPAGGWLRSVCLWVRDRGLRGAAEATDGHPRHDGGDEPGAPPRTAARGFRGGRLPRHRRLGGRRVRAGGRGAAGSSTWPCATRRGPGRPATICGSVASCTGCSASSGPTSCTPTTRNRA